MMNLPLPGNRFENTKFSASKKNNPASGKALLNAHFHALHELKQVPLSDLINPLLAAVGQKQPWIDDFGNDQIMLPRDLYEVIEEFKRIQPQLRTAGQGD